jgi:predicted TIM-barrel fold metal-dependent hydrolase
MRIDCHVHYSPPAMREGLAAFGEVEPYWKLLVAPDADGHSLQGWVTPEQMIADMDRAGLDRVVLVGEAQTRHETCVERNNIGLELIRRWPERIIAFAVVQPLAGQKAIDELKRCADGGMRGMGEMGHYSGMYRFDNRHFLKIVEECIRLNIPINLHSNEEVGHFYLGKSTIPLRDYYHLICRYPEMKLIMAHWGGGLFFYEVMPEVKRNLKNVYYDTAGGPLIFPTRGVFNSALQIIDHHKILYGSDYPLMICPKKQQSPDFRPFLAEIDELGLEKEIYADILGNNCARLLGLAPEEHEPEQSVVKKKSRRQRIITELEDAGEVKPGPYMAVSLVAATWPGTQEVFDRYGIPWKDSPVPYWEPVVQAAAAHGMGSKQQEQLLAELIEAAEDQEESPDEY